MPDKLHSVEGVQSSPEVPDTLDDLCRLLDSLIEFSAFREIKRDDQRITTGMINRGRILGFIITAPLVLIIAIGIGLWISQRFGFNQLRSVGGVLTAEIVIISLAGLFLSGNTTDEEDEQPNEWRNTVRQKANRIVHQWESNNTEDYEGRETIQDEITTTCSELDELLSEPPANVSEQTSQLVRQVVEASEGMGDLQTKTNWGLVDMTASDPEIPIIGMSEEEIREQFVDQGSEIVDNARQLVDHLESN